MTDLPEKIVLVCTKPCSRRHQGCHHAQPHEFFSLGLTPEADCRLSPCFYNDGICVPVDFVTVKEEVELP